MAKVTPAKTRSAKGKSTLARPMGGHVALVATRKGAWIFRSDRLRRVWQTDGPSFLGHIISHMVLDPRDGKTLLAAAKTGHLGPTIFRSTNLGKSWTEASTPPAFAKAKPGEIARAVDHTFWLTPSNNSEPGVWYAGTSPQGLYRSEDGGRNWASVSGFNDDPAIRPYLGGEQDGTPDGPKLHSINVDPRDASHLYLGLSSGGVHESTDGGKTWRTLIQGLDVVGGFDVTNPGFHDPHCMRLCPSNPDRLYQQNHCGIYRLDRPGETWVRIGRAMPKRVGDIGFPIVVHPRDDKVAWVLPMDGTSVWPRTCPDGIASVFVTKNGGGKWQRQQNGLPPSAAWWTVMRQAMAVDSRDPVGVYFGTTSGEIWFSRNEGEKWAPMVSHLPEIFALELADLA
jgi:photosystem II stability/assembly factor-like uncharacterized protein